MTDAYAVERARVLEIFAARMRAARERCGLSQESLAEVANVHRTQISALELGRREPHLTMLLILKDTLGTNLLDGLPVPQERRPATHRKGRKP
jgi:transcriptional regulator with XRE-family HTH domain